MHNVFKSNLSKPSKLLITFQRGIGENSKRKRIIGETVKRVNKENKYLFGNLLESRSQRRRSSKYINEKPTVAYGSQNQVFPSDEKEGDEIDVNLCPRTQTNWTRVTRVSATSKYDINTPKSIDTHHSLNPSVEFSAKPSHRNTSAVVIPSVVLKSIKGFPLINRDKSVNSSYSLESQETLLSRNREYSKQFPSVGKILNATMSDMSKILLKKWREKMIASLGEEGFLKFNRAQLNAGIQFHMAVQSFLRGASEETLVLDGQGVSGCWKSLSSVISEINRVQVLEGAVFHPHLFYHGVLDCIASYQGEEVLIEWKKSDKPKPTLEKTYDAPVQLSAYMGAMNYDQNYPLWVNGGLVVIAYSDGSPADVFHLTLSDCNIYWNSWLERVQLFWSQQQEEKQLSQESGNKEL